TADVRSVMTIGATSTSANLLTLRLLSGQTGNPLVVQNISSTTIFSLDTSGGFIATASSTISSGGLVVSGSPIQASSTVILVGGTGTSTFAGGISVASIGGLSSGAGLTLTGGNILQTNTATNTLRGLSIPAGGIAVATLVSCDTIDTDASGNFFCGTDTGGGADPNVILKLVGGTTYLAASTTANAWYFDTGFVSNASSTINSSLKLSGNLAASSTLRVTGLTTLFGNLNASSTATSTFAGGINVASIGGLSSGSGLVITGGNISQTNSATNTLSGGLAITGFSTFGGLSASASSTFCSRVNIGYLLQLGGWLNASSTATSTFAQGMTLSGGCFAIGLTCVGGVGSSGFTDDGTLVRLTTQTDNVSI
ncbi:MAG: hypothetical protein AAB737_03585, partial [Patescibacteria group bacterium]